MARKRLKLPAEILEAFREFGRQGGRKGGKARMSALTPEERQALARKAIETRWARHRKARPKPSTRKGGASGS